MELYENLFNISEMLEGYDPLESASKPLTFEDFTAKIPGTEAPTHNNFYLFFVRGSWHQRKPQFQRFSAENPELTARLVKKITGDDEGASAATSTKFDEELYEAYKIFKSYSYTDEELFS